MQPAPAGHFSNSLCHYFTLFSEVLVLKWECIIVEAILLHIETCFCVRCAVMYSDLFRKYMSELCCSITAAGWGQSWERASASISTMEKGVLHSAADSDGKGLVQLPTHWWWMPSDLNRLLFWSSVITIFMHKWLQTTVFLNFNSWRVDNDPS